MKQRVQFLQNSEENEKIVVHDHHYEWRIYWVCSSSASHAFVAVLSVSANANKILCDNFGNHTQAQSRLKLLKDLLNLNRTIYLMRMLINQSPNTYIHQSLISSIATTPHPPLICHCTKALSFYAHPLPFHSKVTQNRVTNAKHREMPRESRQQNNKKTYIYHIAQSLFAIQRSPTRHIPQANWLKGRNVLYVYKYRKINRKDIGDDDSACRVRLLNNQAIWRRGTYTIHRYICMHEML